MSLLPVGMVRMVGCYGPKFPAVQHRIWWGVMISTKYERHVDKHNRNRNQNHWLNIFYQCEFWIMLDHDLSILQLVSNIKESKEYAMVGLWIILQPFGWDRFRRSILFFKCTLLAQPSWQRPRPQVTLSELISRRDSQI